MANDAVKLENYPETQGYSESDRGFLKGAGIAADYEYEAAAAATAAEEEESLARLEAQRRAEIASAESAAEKPGAAATKNKPSRGQEKPNVLGVTSFLMIGTALLYDGVQIGLQGIGDIVGLTIIGLAITFVASMLSVVISIYAWLTFYIWFKLRGMSMRTSIRMQMLKQMRKFLVLALAGIVESIPQINMIPGWTAAVILNLVFEYLESRVPGFKKLEEAASRTA